MNEWVHIVWLVLIQEVQFDIVSLADSVAIQDLVRWVVVCGDERVETVQ